MNTLNVLKNMFNVTIYIHNFLMKCFSYITTKQSEKQSISDFDVADIITSLALINCV